MFFNYFRTLHNQSIIKGIDIILYHTAKLDQNMDAPDSSPINSRNNNNNDNNNRLLVSEIPFYLSSSLNHMASLTSPRRSQICTLASVVQMAQTCYSNLSEESLFF